MFSISRALFLHDPSGALTSQPGAVWLQVPHTDSELHRRHIERTRREAQLAALQYEEERMRTKQIQREAVIDFVKVPPFTTYSILLSFLNPLIITNCHGNYCLHVTLLALYEGFVQIAL